MIYKMIAYLLRPRIPRSDTPDTPLDNLIFIDYQYKTCRISINSLLIFDK
jgi:hypothetical protein